MDDVERIEQRVAELLDQYCVYAKVYGERNTGTNFVENLLDWNFGVICLEGRTRVDNVIRPLHGRISKPLRRAFRNAISEIDGQRMLTSEFGWKHGVPPLELIRSAPHARHTLFVCVTKHPIFWLRSLMARPYNPMDKSPKTFSEFIRHDWQVTERDNLEGRRRVNVVELWNLKCAALQTVSGTTEKCLVIAYEKILSDPLGFLTKAAAHLVRTEAEFTWSLPSTKGDDIAFEEYQKKYDLRRVRTLVSDEDLGFMRERVDRSVLAGFGYEL